MKIKNLFYALLALPLFFVACDENKDVDQVKNPTVKVTAGSTTESSLSFIIESSEATKVAYLVVEGSDVPTTTEVLTTGKTVDANKAAVVTEENLAASTTYIVVAAVQNSKSSVKDYIQMTTKAAETPGGDEPGGDEPGGDEPGGDEPGTGDETDKVEFAATHIVTDYSNEDGMHIYAFELGNNTWASNGWGVDGGTYYSFKIVSTSKGNGVLPNGTYSLASTYTANTIIEDYSYRYQMANGDLVNGMEMFKDANLVITNGKIEANIEMANGEIHHVVYEGDLTVGDGGTQVPTEFKATHTADKWYWGGSSSYGYKYMVSGEGFSVDMHFPTQYASETALTAQLYTWTNTSWWGYNDFVDFTTRSFTVDGASVAVDAGTALIKAEGDVYHIEVTLQGRDGFVYMIQYDGKLNDKGEVGGDEEQNNNLVVNSLAKGVQYNSSIDYIQKFVAEGDNFSFNLLLCKEDAQDTVMKGGSYSYATSKGNLNTPGYFNIENFYLDGVKYTVDGSSSLTIETEDMTNVNITLNICVGSDTYVATYNGVVGGNSGSVAEATKLATPSVFASVDGNTAVVSWQEIVGAKDYTVTVEGSEPKTVTNAYITLSNLAWETTYNVSVVANSSNEVLYITSDAGTYSFTTGAQPEGDENEGGNTGGPVASYEDWNFDASLDQSAMVVTCTDGSHTVTFKLNTMSGGTFYLNGNGTLNVTEVTVNGVVAESISGTMAISTNHAYRIVLDAYIDGVHYTGTSNNPVV